MKLGICIAAFSLIIGTMGHTSETAQSATFATFDERAKAGKALSVVFFGGSLTWGAQATDPQQTSYRALVSKKLKDAYPQARFEFLDKAIGGTGSQLGAFRLERDVLAHKPDLVFLDFTINDDPYPAPDPDRLASYESLVRRMAERGIPVVQILLPAKRDVLPNPPERPLDAPHRQIAEAYGSALGDAVALVRARVAEGKATPDELWDVPGDVTHPGDAGYALYAETAWAALQQAIAQRQEGRVPERMLNADTYMAVNRFKLAALPSLPKGWSAGKPTRSAIAFDFTPSRWMETVAVASRAKGQSETPEPLVLKVRGRNLMFFGEATPDSGKYRVLVDGKEVKTADIGAMAQKGNWRYVQTLAQGLDASVPHKVEIIPELEPGQEFRMESLCVAGDPATVEAFNAN